MTIPGTLPPVPPRSRLPGGGTPGLFGALSQIGRLADTCGKGSPTPAERPVPEGSSRVLWTVPSRLYCLVLSCIPLLPNSVPQSCGPGGVRQQRAIPVTHAWRIYNFARVWGLTVSRVGTLTGDGFCRHPKRFHQSAPFTPVLCSFHPVPRDSDLHGSIIKVEAYAIEFSSKIMPIEIRTTTRSRHARDP